MAKSLEEAKQYFQDQLGVVQLPAGWKVDVEESECPGCHKAVLTAHFRNDEKAAGGIIRLAHIGKLSGGFDDVEESCAEFIADELPSIIKRLETLDDGEEGAFINLDIAEIPGLGTAIVVSGADILSFLDSLIERAEEEAGKGEQEKPADE